MPPKTAFEVAVEMYKAVEGSRTGQKRLKSSTFWNEFQVRSRQSKTVQRIARLLNEQHLDVAVKSGKPLGKEDKNRDWIVLTLRDHAPLEDAKLDKQGITLFWPPPQWFEHIKTREFETEREVEAYFVDPLLDRLGYDYEDIVMGYPLQIYKGMKKFKREVDFVVFNGPSRKQKDALLLVEARPSDQGISSGAIWQARTYAKELAPACYLVTNGRQIVVFQFNTTSKPDERVMILNRSELKEKWETLYAYVSKAATIERKKRMRQW